MLHCSTVYYCNSVYISSTFSGNIIKSIFVFSHYINYTCLREKYYIHIRESLNVKVLVMTTRR